MRKSVTNRIIKYSLNEKKNLAIGMVFTVLMTIFEIVGPIILAYIINNLLTGEKLVYNIRKLALVLCLYAVVFNGVFGENCEQNRTQDANGCVRSHSKNADIFLR